MKATEQHETLTELHELMELVNNEEIVDSNDLERIKTILEICN